ncbi:MAG TPA: hypothetical protein VFE17_08315 [Candidatus Baltobacteraceae bacterium]|jgi:hypothetical protein|nr:hypothetical protein [Candidatus Baltobacteraceae bacterium]
MSSSLGRYVACLVFVPAFVALAIPGGAQTNAAVSPLLQRLIAVSTAVKSYTASVHADVAMHTFPYLSPSLEGMYYHKEPSRNKIIFTSGLPFMAEQFSKVYPQVESPSRWTEVYDISSEGDTAGFTTLKLVPKKHGRVDHIDAKIDDKTAELVSLRWNYNDGGYATLDQTYSPVQGYTLVTQQTGHLEIPHWTADLKSTFSDFKLNANIPDSIFTSQ